MKMSRDCEYLNVDNFKRWIADNPESEGQPNMIGMEVQARYGAKKTMRNMSVESGRAGKVIREFMDVGGVVREVSGGEYLVEVPSGGFTIHKKFLVT